MAFALNTSSFMFLLRVKRAFNTLRIPRIAYILIGFEYKIMTIHEVAIHFLYQCSEYFFVYGELVIFYFVLQALSCRSEFILGVKKIE